MIERSDLSKVSQELLKRIHYMYKNCFYRHIDQVCISRLKKLSFNCWIKVDKTIFPKDDLKLVFEFLEKDFDVYVDNKESEAMFVTSDRICFVVSDDLDEDPDVIVLLENYIK